LITIGFDRPLIIFPSAMIGCAWGLYFGGWFGLRSSQSQRATEAARLTLAIGDLTQSSLQISEARMRWPARILEAVLCDVPGPMILEATHRLQEG
jgi:hypothetical protein